MQRARSTDAKAERRAQIIVSAASAFDTHGADLTLVHVAALAGLTRSTLYGYAATREELLILLADHELEQWFSALRASLHRVTTAPGVANGVVRAVLAQRRLPPLLALCPTVFEHNITVQSATSWKQRAHDQIIAAGAGIDTALKVPTGSGARFLLHFSAAVIGLHGYASPPAVAQKAIDDAGLALMRIDYATELHLAAKALAAALLTRSTARSNSPQKRKAS